MFPFVLQSLKMSHWLAVVKIWGKIIFWYFIILFYQGHLKCFLHNLWSETEQPGLGRSDRSELQVSEYKSRCHPPTCCCSVALGFCWGIPSVGEIVVWSWQHPWGALMAILPSQLYSPPADPKDFPVWTLQAWQLLVLYLVGLFSTIFFSFWKLYILLLWKNKLFSSKNALNFIRIISTALICVKQETWDGLKDNKHFFVSQHKAPQIRVVSSLQ